MDDLVEIESGEHGLLPGISVVGFQGAFDRAHTPGRAAPVFMHAATGRLARAVEPREPWAMPARAHQRVRFRLFDAEVRSGAIPGEATRIGPWPARLGATVLVVGDDERREFAWIHQSLDAPEDDRVREFLQWFGGSVLSGAPKLLADRGEGEGLGCWYCPRGDAKRLEGAVAALAWTRLVDALRGRSTAKVIACAFWLYRAGDRTDACKAAAALKLHRYSRWQSLLGNAPADNAMLGEAERAVAGVLKGPAEGHGTPHRESLRSAA